MSCIAVHSCRVAVTAEIVSLQDSHEGSAPGEPAPLSIFSCASGAATDSTSRRARFRDAELELKRSSGRSAGPPVAPCAGKGSMLPSNSDRRREWLGDPPLSSLAESCAALRSHVIWGRVHNIVDLSKQPQWNPRQFAEMWLHTIR